MRYNRRVNWKPIETAPRDGSAFLAFEHGMMAVGCFSTWSSGETFHIEHVTGYEYEFDLERPSHWMELPKPPQTPE